VVAVAAYQNEKCFITELQLGRADSSGKNKIVSLIFGKDRHPPKIIFNNGLAVF
jgi:hypothetical protein